MERQKFVHLGFAEAVASESILGAAAGSGAKPGGVAASETTLVATISAASPLFCPPPPS